MRELRALGYRVEYVKAMDLCLPYHHFRELWVGIFLLYVRLGGRPLRVAFLTPAYWDGLFVLPFAALIPAFPSGFGVRHGAWMVGCCLPVSAILAVVTILQAESVGYAACIGKVISIQPPTPGGFAWLRPQ